MANHPALMAADARIAARDAGVELADQRSRPEWALDVAYSYRNGSLPGGDPRSDFITVGVTITHSAMITTSTTTHCNQGFPQFDSLF